MFQLVYESVCARPFASTDLGLPSNTKKANVSRWIYKLGLLATGVSILASGSVAQNVPTQHGDLARTGNNVNESILTTANVNASSFGKLFSQTVDGQIYAQPLYVANVPIFGKGTHNVVFVATENDSIYAFDADNNGGANASPLWKITLLDAAHGAGAGATAVPNTDLSTPDVNPKLGITGTPTIDTNTNTMYVVGKTKESGAYFERLHAIDLTTGNEKFGGPVAITASVSGNGVGSSGGTLNFDPKWEHNRAGLLLLNGFVYVAFGSHGDNGPWHGWIISYNASNLQQAGVWCTAPNGIGAGVWMGGSGLAADNNNPNGTSPGGRMFISTGNGDFNASTPYNSTMNYGDSIVRLELTNGAMKVADTFTPSNQAALNSADLDLAAGGVLLLPDQSTGGHTHLLVQLGKQGKVYLVDRDNMSGFHSTDAMVESFLLNSGNTSTGLWGMPSYSNNTVYIWGTQDNMKSFPISAGKLPTTASKTGSNTSGFPSPTATISSSGGANSIAWTVQTDNYNSGGNATLRAYDAGNISSALYSSSTNSARDNPGASVKFVVPTVANGKVYVGTNSALAVYGLLNGSQQAAAPSISPAGQAFTGTLNVTITDSTPSASIFYSTTGTATTSSTPYTGPIAITSTTTISAIASAPGFLQSLPVSQTYTQQTQTLMPTFSVIPGNYTSPQTVTITSASPNPTIYYAINAPASTSSTPFAGSATVTVSQSETINAIATSPGLSTSPQSSATFNIGSGSGISFGNGFSTSASTMTFNGATKLDDTRLQLSDGGAYEASSAWFNTPVNIQSFNNTFSFQLSNAQADGITFTIQNTGLTAVGPAGGGLGYGPDTPGGTPGIGKSVAIKFDLYDNAGESGDSVGLYTNGASPTTPFIDMTGTGPDLHSGDAMTANMVYDGTKLTLTLTDGVANKSFQTSWIVNIPQIVGGNTAYVGFTAGTGGLSASQKITTWTFASGTGNPPLQQVADPIFSLAGGTYSGTQSVSITDTTPGSTIFYTTDGTNPATSATGTTKQYTGALSVATSQTIKAIATASGLTASNVVSAAYNITSQSATATPNISPATGTYSSAQTVTITDATPGATIFYALNGPVSTSSTQYTGPFVVNSTTMVNSIATTPNFATSATSSSTLTIQTGGSTPVNFGAGFAAGGMQLNGKAALNGTRLRLTDTTANNEAGSAFFTTPVSVTSFTNDFTFQQSAPNADGMTFTIQRAAVTALGPSGGGLGYGPDTPGAGGGIVTSLAVKFDLYDNNGEGTNSTGLYVNGASPTTPATTLGGNVNLHSGDPFHVVMVYDGTTLTMTITDTVNSAQTFTTSWPVNIATTIGANTAFVGFTGGTGGLTTTQEIIQWTYSTSAAPPPSQAATPAFNPPGGTFSGTQSVSITDSTAGAAIFYTTDGTSPATSVTGTTKQYNTALSVASTQTIKAIATASGFSASNISTAAYTINGLPAAATPVISPPSGNYTSAQTVSITDSTSGASIFYALNGPATTSSTPYTGPFTVNSTTIVNAIATAPNFSTSATGTSTITIQTSTGGSTPVNFASGFSASGMQFNGNAKLNGTRLQLTDATTAFYETGSAFFATPVSVTSFTNDFTFQMTSPNADGMTFTIQRSGPTAIGPTGGGLGYGPGTPGGTPLGIPTSIAVKFDLFDNGGEGVNSTGLYTNGNSPTLPATTLGGGVNLHSGDSFHVVMSYDGTTLTMTITDTVNTAQTFTTSWPINIGGTIGGTTAYVGFTGATGGQTATQEIVNWSYTTSATVPPPPPPKNPVVYQATALPAASSGPVWRQFAWTGFPDGQGMVLDSTAVGNSITLTVNVATAGIYDVKVASKDNNARGTAQLAVNGANLGAPLDEYQATDAGVYITGDFGNFNFVAPGNYALKFTLTGKNAASSGFSWCVDTITLTPQ